LENFRPDKVMEDKPAARPLIAIASAKRIYENAEGFPPAHRGSPVESMVASPMQGVRSFY
jgi:hypothetical protein